jgi:hypothetical protein
MNRHVRTLVTLIGAMLGAAPAGAINVQFDYTFDTGGFFASQARRDLLTQAAGTFTPFTDSLSAITPSGQNTWDAQFSHPSADSVASVPNLNVPANTVIIYVGAYDLPTGTLGHGGPGGYGASGFQPWFDLLDTRGQAGASRDPSQSTDFGPWGGSVAFDSTTNWFFGQTPVGQTPTQSDFLSVAIHEIGHVLGIGTAESFLHDTSGANFIGDAAVAVHGGQVPLNPSDKAHWADNVTGHAAAGGATQEAAMSPFLNQGTRKVFTDLDYAGMKDIGWQAVIPHVALPGDTNGDGFINAIDLAAMNNGITGRLSGWSNGDFDGNGIANADDYAIFEYYAALHAGDTSPVTPEPSMGVVLLAAAVLVRKRHCRCRL